MRLIKSLKKIDYKLFFALIVLGLVPTLYTTVRVFFLGGFPSEYSFSIAGQLSWVNLFYEIIQEGIIFPLYFFMGKVISDKEKLTNRVKTGMIVSFAIYFVLSLIIFIFAKPLLSLMATSTEIIEQSATYIRIETVASLVGILSSFLLVVLVQIGKQKYLYYLTGLKLVMCVLLDTFLVSNIGVSAKLGVNGIGITNIIVNVVLFVLSLILVNKENIKIFVKSKLDFSWMKEFVKIGGISGLESFVRNIAYMLMICRMVNVVGEQGTYWVANNFIWGWLLLPILQLGELIKKDCAEDEKAIQNKSLGYFSITTIVCLLWCITIPLWKPFMANVLQFNDVDKLFELVMVLLGFYMVFAFQNVFDAIFYGIGKTSYMLFESIVTNTVYYGICFILYVTGVWEPSLIGIALMFGIGNAFDGIVSLGVYIYLLKKRKINILNIE
ncbi:MAG: MATE family efflux transporter [Clostridia bacterium]|nr:MATE family efflux transporter [Clostridia bacterium]